MSALRTGQITRDLHFKHESELHGNGEVGNRTRDLRRSMRADRTTQYRNGTIADSERNNNEEMVQIIT